MVLPAEAKVDLEDYIRNLESKSQTHVPLPFLDRFLSVYWRSLHALLVKVYLQQQEQKGVGKLDDLAARLLQNVYGVTLVMVEYDQAEGLWQSVSTGEPRPKTKQSHRAREQQQQAVQ